MSRLTADQWETIAEDVLFGDANVGGQGHHPRPDDPTGLAQRALERTAAIGAAALAGDGAPPQRVHERLAAAGLAHCAAIRRNQADEMPHGGFTTSLTGRATSTGRLLGFALATAAAAAALWFALLQPREPALRDLRSDVLAHDDSAVHADWQAGVGEAHPRGDVVWSQRRQDGWLRFHGLPPLGPEQAYQLWIVDADRQGAPVDGGVFTITRSESPDGEVLVPIHAKLPIGHPKAFVVTIEDRQGVVVSAQEHVVAVASL